ncbi:Nucleotide-diphospho-sugar transferase [Rhypophila sp. PSN 637]
MSLPPRIHLRPGTSGSQRSRVSDRDPFQDPSDASSLGQSSRRTSVDRDDTESPAIHSFPRPARVLTKTRRHDGDEITPAPARQGSRTLGEKLSNPFASQTDIERSATPSAFSASDEKAAAAADAAEQEAASPGRKSRNPFKRMYAAFRRTYCPIEEPGLVFPTGPTDEEKAMYLHTNRVPLYIFGIFSFLSLSAGMWLFAVCAPIFAWYGAFVGFLNIYLFISYLVGIVGKDWDYQAHLDIVEKFPINDETAPTVDVYLPCCSEPLEILENTYKHITKLDWPAHKLKVWVMDDGNQPAVKALAESYGFNYLVRDDRPRLRKAGNLRWTFARTEGDYFAIFDADFCPRPDFLRELVVEHMADDKTAILQSPQFFRTTDDQTWVEQGAGATQELFYRVVQVNRNKWGASICVGSNAVYRRAALVDVGGTAEIGFSEDVHTGFGAVDRGWKVKYVPLNLATGICPNTPRSFFSQQMRWARGSTTLLTTKHFWVSNLTFMQKVCYLCGLLYYSAVSLGIFISPIPGTLLLFFRPEWFKYYNLAFAIPSIVYGAIVFRYWAKASYGFNVQHVMVIMSYAYLTAIKDRLFGIELLWAASGDKKAHKSNKYRNMRIVCWVWTIFTTGGMVSAVTYQLTRGMDWYHTLPLIILNVYNLYIANYFLFASWRW